MIPIDSSETLKHTDGESGITYEFRFLLGDMQEKYFDMMETVSRCHRETNDLIKITKNMTSEEIEANSEISEKNDKLQKELLTYRKALIDMFLCGWSSESNKKLPAITNKPSSNFFPDDIEKMASLIQSLLPQLTSVNAEVSKN